MRILGGSSGVVAVIAVVAMACTDPASSVSGMDPGEPSGMPLDPVPYPYPDPDWATAAPESQGIDPAALAAAATAAGDRDSHCLLVIRHGMLVGEYYFGGADRTTMPRSWSIAKSYTATVVGIALGNGDLAGLDMRPAEWLPDWIGTPREAITLRDLVAMTSGLAWSVFADYVQMVTVTRDHSDHAVHRDADVEPGATWTYNNAAVQVIEPLFRAVTGGSIEDYARTQLWAKLGMAPTTTWAHDPAGNPTTYANVLATCRDHARLGYLYLRGGRWRDEQVVPAEWIAAARTPSNPHNRGYGYLLWLNGEGPTTSALNESKPEMLAPWAPHNLFAARGFGGQFVDVIPSLDLVVVRFGPSPLDHVSADWRATAASLAESELQDTDTHRAIVEPIVRGIR